MDLLELLKGINYLSFVVALVKWLAIFLVISIAILIVGSKFKLFTRKNKIANVLAKFYYAFIPIYFMFFAVKYAPVKNTQSELNKAIDNNKEVLTVYANEFVGSVISDSLLTQNTSVKDIVNKYLDTKMYSQDTSDVKFAARFLHTMKRKIEYSFLSRLLESKAIGEVSGAVGVNKKTATALYQTNMHDLFQEGEIVDLFKLELNKLFGRIYNSMFLMFGLVLLIPGVEISLSKYFKY